MSEIVQHRWEGAEGRKILRALGASLGVHLAACLGMGMASLMPSPLPVVPEEEAPMTVTMIEPPEEPPSRSIEAPAQPLVIRTPDRHVASEVPEAAMFESDKNTRAGSERVGDGAGPLPTMEGDDGPALNLEETRHAQGAIGQVPGERRVEPSRPAVPEERPAPLEMAKLQAPPPSALTPEELPRLEDSLATLAMRRERAETAPREAAPREVEARPSVSDPSRSGAGYQPELKRRRVRGGVSEMGPVGVDARETPLGRYQREVSDVIGSRWYFLIDRRRDLISYGAVAIQFSIGADGRVAQPDVVKRDSNEALVSTSIEAVLDAELPPIPPDVAGALKSESLTITMHFRIY